MNESRISVVSCTKAAISVHALKLLILQCNNNHQDKFLVCFINTFKCLLVAATFGAQTSNYLYQVSYCFGESMVHYTVRLCQDVSANILAVQLSVPLFSVLANHS